MLPRRLPLATAVALVAACADPTRPTPAGGGAPRAAVAALPGALPVGTRLAPGKCMDVLGARTDAGTPLIIWSCHGGGNQQFVLPPVGGSGEIRAFNSMCVDAAGGRGNDDGDAALIWPCHGGANQRGTVDGNGEIRGINGKCLDVTAADPSDGTGLLIWSCHGGRNQRWDVGAGEPATAVLVGAGDVARCGSTDDDATAALLDGIPGTVFAAGDLAYEDGSAADFRDCYEASWGRHGWRTRPAPGNHEYQTAGAAGYFWYFGAAAGAEGAGYYSYELGGWHVVVLNSNIDAAPGSAQAAWLRNDLAAHPRACTVAYWHHPRFSSGRHGNHPHMAALWRILQDAGAELVLAGHDHAYERFASQNADGGADPERGIRSFVVGTGGSSLRPFATVQPNSEARRNDVYGVLKLDLSAGGYRWSFVGTDGGVRDAGGASCR
jgi:hypothetical protein